MGAPKQKWTKDEEDALRRGIAKHGVGKWRSILHDPDFAAILSQRSNIDLKDKFRNLSQGLPPKKKIKLQKSNGGASKPSSRSLVCSLSCPKETASIGNTGQTHGSENENDIVRYEVMISEALNKLNEPDGSEIPAIYSYIQQRYSVPQTFRKLLSGKLRRLVQQNKLEKVNKGYKLKETSSSTSILPKKELAEERPVVFPAFATPKKESSQERSIVLPPVAASKKESYEEPPFVLPDTVRRNRSTNPMEIAANAAAYALAFVGEKMRDAAKAVAEAEMAANLAEENQTYVTLFEEVLAQCKQGKLVTMRRTA